MDKSISESSKITQPIMKVVRVTPGLAADWLQRSSGNRPVAKQNVKRLSAAIKSGKWKFTGDPIRFSKTGKLIDGQHRLQAIVDAGIAVEAAVMQGLDDEIFDVIDTGKSRSKSDVVFITHQLPQAKTALLSSTANLAFQYATERFAFSSVVENKDLLNFIDENPDLISAVNIVYDRAYKDGPVAKSVIAAFYFYAARLDVDLADQFIDRFMVGIITGRDDNLHYLRTSLFAARLHRKPYSKSRIFASLIKVWNAERRGRPIKHRGNIVRKDTQFPSFI